MTDAQPTLWAELREAVRRGVRARTSVGLFTLWLFSRGRWKTAQV